MNAVVELKEQTFNSILSLDTKSKIEIYRILKRNTEDPELINRYDGILHDSKTIKTYWFKVKMYPQFERLKTQGLAPFL